MMKYLFLRAPAPAYCPCFRFFVCVICVICGCIPCSLLLSNYLHQYALSSTAIKLAIEDLLPWAKVQLTVRNSNNHFAPHHLSLDMSIAIVLAREIVMVRAQ